MRPFTARVILWVIACVLAGDPIAAQRVSHASPVSDTSIFAPLTLPPAPSATRMASGAPGSKYWQNRADYDIRATFDTTTRTLRGSMVLHYTNRSPDTLKVFWFQTEQSDEVIDQFDQLVRGKPTALTREHPDGDVFELKVTPAEPLPPGKTAIFQVQWHFQVGNHAVQEFQQWYPRPNVYDDVKGWNTESLATGAEYYIEYGDFQMAVTLPASYIVAATGTLDNPTEVLTATERARLALAAHTDTVVRIITAEELRSGVARPKGDAMLTWKFHARNVRDMAWATAPDYQWDATHWQHTLVQTYYRPEIASMWDDAADMARMSIQDYTKRWFPYPYSQVSVVGGPEYGMEYPMLAMVSGKISGGLGATPTKPELYHIITHEVAHNWFPMLVGSNERVHAWMDEGFVTFMISFGEAHRYPEHNQEARIEHRVFTGTQHILETGTVNDNGQYEPTAYVLQLLRQDVLGPAVFDKAFRIYIQRWANKHPTPMDFFRTMENVSGRKLDWFWRECFLEAPRFDQAIDSVSQTVQGAKTHVTVTYGNRGRAVMPLLVHFTFSDSTTQDVTYPADVWRANSTTYTVSYTFAKKTVRHIVLDPDIHLPDADRSNNVWTAQ